MDKFNHKEVLFGLDIGTRTVIGIAGYYESETFHIIKSVCMEHQERAMLDGQIHDIEKVANIVDRVKKELEKQIGMPLTEVSIAAAGRVLNTQITKVSEQFEEVQPITPLHIQALQVEGINAAQKMLEKEKGLHDSDYFCVGHTVMQYYLDGHPILNLEGHKGQTIGVKVLATFLPKEVVDSLYTVTQRVGLEVTQLTLEPIAAINAIIPENLRLLNLALVDVGAGTSDLAITKDGSVLAYGMIPLAGDEVTETILHHYLVDFQTAEKMKQQLDTHEVITFNDIIGLPYEVGADEVKRVIEPTINRLAEEIATKIIELNGDKPTNAVFCVGGGSQMYGLISKISEILGIAEQRVALRTCEHIPNITYKKNTMRGPEMITPIGICLTTARYNHKQFTRVTFNGEALLLLNTKKLTLLDALIEKGIKHTDLFPLRGKTLMYKLNDERVRLKGTVGSPSQILLNGEVGSLDAYITSGDKITFEPAINGENGKICYRDCIKVAMQKCIIVNDDRIELPLLMANGDYVTPEYQVSNQDILRTVSLETVEQLLDHLNFSYVSQMITINHQEVSLETKLNDGDIIQINHIINEKVSVNPALQIETPTESVEDQMSTDKGITLMVNEKIISLPEQEKQYMFVHVFDFIEFDLTKPQGTIQLKLNDQRAAVTDLLKNGDRLQIYWEK